MIGGSAGGDSISGGAGHDVLRGYANAATPPNYFIHTYAGNGRPTLGDGGPATAATLSGPDQVLASSSGVVFISDTNNNRVAAVSALGVISTFAGTVSAESQRLGDGGPAVEGAVRFPHGLFETGAGLYIGDHSYTVRLVNKAGVINHAALEDRAAFILPWSVAVDSGGRVYIAWPSGHQVLRAEPNGTLTVIAGTGVAGTTGDGGQGSVAQINSPRDLGFDAQGNLLIGSATAAMRQVNLSTGVITTRLQSAVSHFDLDKNGAFVASRGNQVLRIDPVTGVEIVIAGSSTAGFSGDGGPAIDARFSNIQGVSVDAAGNIFVVDSGNNRVRKITPDGVVTTFAGGGPPVASLTGVMDSQGLDFDPSGNLFLTDFQYHFIRRVMPDGTTKVVAGTGIAGSSGDGAAASNATFDHPSILRFDRAGNLFFLDLNGGTGVVRMIRPGADGLITGASDEVISTVAGKQADRSLADNGAADGGPARNAVFVAARDFVFDSKGALIIADWLGHRIRKVSPGADGVFNGAADEVITTIAGRGGESQSGDGGLATAAQVGSPNRLAIDAQDNLYVFVGVNTAEAAIRRIDAQTGVITTVARGVNIADMIVDRAGRLLYADYSGKVMQVDTTTGVKTVVAGTGETGFSGDGGSALSASFRGASYLAVDDTNAVLIVDNGNFRVRQLIDHGDGRDTFSGGAGDDTIDGGSGIDVAVFSGRSSDYEVTATSNSEWRIRDLRLGSLDGADSVRGIEVLLFSDGARALQPMLPQLLDTAVQNLLRSSSSSGAAAAAVGEMMLRVSGGASTSAAIGEAVKAADAATSVATLAYQFFTGKIPGLAGIDYLVSPTGPNPNNLNSAYYQNFNLENRYINFAVNLGKVGEGAARFQTDYGALTLAQATKKAYGVIFGTEPTDAKVTALLSGGRDLYFESYGKDGLNGQGTKAAMVGWLLAEAAKADLGMYARANDAFLLDLADGATFAIDLIGVYGKPEFNYVG